VLYIIISAPKKEEKKVSEQSKFFKQEGCATTDNMFRMAFHAQKYIPLIQIIVKLALGFSDCNRFN
jgi:hypothetical protein